MTKWPDLHFKESIFLAEKQVILASHKRSLEFFHVSKCCAELGRFFSIFWSFFIYAILVCFGCDWKMYDLQATHTWRQFHSACDETDFHDNNNQRQRSTMTTAYACDVFVSYNNVNKRALNRCTIYEYYVLKALREIGSNKNMSGVQRREKNRRSVTDATNVVAWRCICVVRRLIFLNFEIYKMKKKIWLKGKSKWTEKNRCRQVGCVRTW